MRSLVAFGTRYGSTGRVAEEIASVLRSRGNEVKVLDLRQGGEDVHAYDLVIIGSSITFGSWSRESLRFLECNSNALQDKAVAMFVCCGDIMLDPGREGEHRQRYLEDVALRFGIASQYPKGLFGGELDLSKYGFLVKAFLNGQRGRLERRGIDPSRPFDFRDWDAIRAWALVLTGP